MAKADNGVTNDQLAQALVTLANAQETAPIRQVPLAKAKIRTPWHPSGERRRPKLSRITRLNGFRLKESRLSNEEILLLNGLVPGKYHDRKWIVTRTDDDEGSAIDVYFPNKTPAQRIDFRAVAPQGLVDALRQITEEAARAAA